MRNEAARRWRMKPDPDTSRRPKTLFLQKAGYKAQGITVFHAQSKDLRIGRSSEFFAHLQASGARMLSQGVFDLYRLARCHC
jgi:hypothetical protein